MKKIIFATMLLLTCLSAKTQNGAQGGLVTLTPGYSFKNMLFGFSAGYNLGMGEKWSTHFGLSYFTRTYNDTYNLSPLVQTTPASIQNYKTKHSIPTFNLHFKKYVGQQGSNEEGGIYLKFGLGYMLYTYKRTADTYDATLYHSGLESRTNKAKYFLAEIQAGFDFSIGDMIFLYVESGTSIIVGEGQYFPINIGIKKVFYKL